MLHAAFSLAKRRETKPAASCGYQTDFRLHFLLIYCLDWLASSCLMSGPYVINLLQKEREDLIHPNLFRANSSTILLIKSPELIKLFGKIKEIESKWERENFSHFLALLKCTPEIIDLSSSSELLLV